MSETNAEVKTENNVETQEKVEPTPRKGKRTSSIASKLAKEAESILKGFGDKEDAPEGRRTTRSSTRGSVAPPVSTPPPAKKERKSSANLNNSTSAPRRGRPKKGGGDDVKPNNDEPKDETNNVEATIDAKETAKANEVDDVEMKDEIVAGVASGNAAAAIVAATDTDTDTHETDAKEAKTETNDAETSPNEASTVTSDDDNVKSNDASATVVSSGSAPSSAATVPSNSSVPSAAPTVPVTSNVLSVSAAATTTTTTTTTANGTVENACTRINRDDKIAGDSTTVDGADITKKVSLAANDEKAAAVLVDEKTTTASPFSDESNKSLNSSSEPLANQTSVTLSSND